METKKLSIRQRRSILKKYMEHGASVRSLSSDYAVSRATIYNILEGRVKKKNTPRSDKGTERPGYGMKLSKDQKKRLTSEDSESDDIATMLEQQAMNLLFKVDKIKNTQSRAKILEAVSRILKQVATHKLESHIKRADATIVTQIIRRYNPNATDEEVIRVWREEVEKLRVNQ